MQSVVYYLQLYKNGQMTSKTVVAKGGNYQLWDTRSFTPFTIQILRMGRAPETKQS